MELLQLRYFVKSAQTENFSTTAYAFQVPPSAVSASVKKLEKELGTPLFDRFSNKIKLNQTGFSFYKAVSQSLLLLDGEVAKIREEKDGISGIISLLIRTERSLVTQKMTTFRKAYPAVNFHLRHVHSNTDYSTYDIIIDEDTNRYTGFIKKRLVEEKIRIAASKHNPLVGKQLHLADLKDVPLIAFSKNSSLYRITEDICLKAGFEPNIVIESDDPYYIRKYIAEDFGVSLFPEASWKENMEDFEFLNVVDFDFVRTTYAYFNVMNAGKSAKLFYEDL